MANTRDFKSLGEFAKNAIEVDQSNQPVRDPSQSYRNTDFSTFQQQQGKQFSVLPVSENVNQQVLNQSQFTNLIDRQGIPGWRFDVEYNIPAVVWGSDGKLYKCIRDGNINVDPITEDPENPNWWSEFVTLQDSSIDYTSQTPGDEGARNVGCTYTPFYNATPDGQILQDRLADDSDRLYKMNNLRVAAWGAFVVSDGSTAPFTPSQAFNISQVSVTSYYLNAQGSSTIGYLTLSFSNNIPTPYMYFLEIHPAVAWAVSENGGVITKRFIQSKYDFVSDALTNEIKIGSLTLDNTVVGKDAGWGREDSLSRFDWFVNFFAFLID